MADEINMTRAEMLQAIQTALTEHGTDEVCHICNSDTFIELTKIKKLSPFVSPTGEKMIVPYKIYVCSKCNAEISDE